MCICSKSHWAEKLSRAFSFMYSVLWVRVQGRQHGRALKDQALEVNLYQKLGKGQGQVSCRHQPKLARSSFPSTTCAAQQQAGLPCGHVPHCRLPSGSSAVNNKILQHSAVPLFNM